MPPAPQETGHRPLASSEPPVYRGRRRSAPTPELTEPLDTAEVEAAARTAVPVPQRPTGEPLVELAPAPLYRTRAQARAAERAEQQAGRRSGRSSQRPVEPERPSAVPQVPSANVRRAPQRLHGPVPEPRPSRRRGPAIAAAVVAVGTLGGVAALAGALPAGRSDAAAATLSASARSIGVTPSSTRVDEQAPAIVGADDKAFRMVAVSRSEERGPIGGCSGQPPKEHYGNGQLPSSALCDLPFASPHKLRGDAAVALIRLDDVYKATFGDDLCLTDSYRSLASQYSLAVRKPVLAARPGTSEHGWGLAIDACGGPDQVGSKRREWFLANAPKFGWDNPAWARPGGSKPEPWHWEYVRGE